MIENQKKLDSQMREKYNIDNMFDMNSARVVNSNEDLEKHPSAYLENTEYSKPKDITKYGNIAENNPDIKDYTDVEDNKLEKYLSEGKNQIKELEEQEKAIIEKTSFFVNIINKLKYLFIRKKEKK